MDFSENDQYEQKKSQCKISFDAISVHQTSHETSKILVLDLTYGRGTGVGEDDCASFCSDKGLCEADGTDGSALPQLGGFLMNERAGAGTE